MGNWNSEEIKTEHDSLQLFWTHNKDRAVYINRDTLHISAECWYRYPVGKYFCSFNAIINHKINEELTIFIGPLLLDGQPYKSLLNFALTWSTDIVRLYFHDIKTAFAFIRDFNFIRIGCLIININVKPLSEIFEQDKYECVEIKYNLIQRIKSSEILYIDCAIYGYGFYINVLDLIESFKLSE